MKLLVDMNLSPRWVEALSAAGFRAEHWSRIGPATATDSEIMDYAAEHDYVVLTHDLDFSAILAATHGTKPSVVQIRADNLNTVIMAAPLIAALKQMAADLKVGALLTVDPGRARIHMLPLPFDEF